MSAFALTLVAARKDLARRLADPAAIAIWIGVPLLIAGLMSLVSGGGGSPRATVLLADRGGGLAGRLLAGAAERAGGLFEVEEADEAEARARMEEGEATALVVLPENLVAALLDGEPASLELVTNPSHRILPGIVRGFLEVLREGAFYLQRLLGEPLQSIRAQAAGEGLASEADVADVAASIQRRLRELEGVLLPPRLTLETEIVEEPSPYADGYGLIVLPGILLMALLFVAQGMSEEVWQEREAGTLRRALCAPHGAGAFLAGKLLAGVALSGAVSFVALVLFVLALDVPLVAVPLSLLWCLLAAAALYALFLCVQIHASSARGGSMLGMIVIFPLMMIGGSFFPFEAMPGWMRAVGAWTPNGIATLQLKALLAGRVEGGALGVAALQLAGFALVLFLVARRRFRSGFAIG